MLHGYGSNEEDLFSFANDLPDELLIVSSRAPMKLDFGGFAWYSIHFNAGQNKFTDIPEAIEARELINNFIDELQEKYHFDNEKSILMGFSQGAILSYAVALTYPEKIKNIMALSGYLLPEIINSSNNLMAIQKLNFFCSHGSVDPVISVDWARKSIAYLKEKAIQLEYKEYPIGHGVSPQNFYDLKSWMDKILK